MAQNDQSNNIPEIDTASQEIAVQAGQAFSTESIELLSNQLLRPPMPKESEKFDTIEIVDSTVYPKPAEFLAPLSPHEANKPNLIVLDDYRIPDDMQLGTGGFSHGELSARVAEENGFNVNRVQIGLLRPGFMDLPGGLKQINEAIENNDIVMGKGDIVNVTIAVEMSFEDASKLLAMSITPDNLKEKRPEIFQALQDKLESPDTNRNNRGLLRQLLNCTEEIQKLQEKGIVVVAAGGNKGANAFNFAMLAADKHYGATTRDGEIAEYSANNSMTEFNRGDIDFYAKPVDAIDPTPIEQQQGYYRIDGSAVRLPANEYGGFLEMTPVNLKNTELLRKLMSPDAITTELVAPDTEAWIKGTEVNSVQGTSFVNLFGLPELVDAEQDRSKESEE